NSLASFGVETIPPEAHAQPAARNSERSSSLPASRSYPCTNGRASWASRGRVVSDKPNGAATSRRSARSYELPVAASIMSPMMMLSELEYLYFVPGVKSGFGFPMYDSSWTGGGATRSDLRTALENAFSLL